MSKDLRARLATRVAVVGTAGVAVFAAFAPAAHASSTSTDAAVAAAQAIGSAVNDGFYGALPDVLLVVAGLVAVVGTIVFTIRRIRGAMR